MCIEANISKVRRHMAHSALLAHRKTEHIQLIAVSKTQPPEAIAQAFAAGLTQFAENYLQEALEKINALQHLPLTWHFIGRIQSNKAAHIANAFSWVHGVSDIKVAQKLSQHRQASLGPLNICIQVNMDNEASKSGVSLADAEPLVQHLLALPNVRLRGFMTILKPSQDSQQQYQSFRTLTTLLEHVNALYGLQLDTLSMGMTDDMDAAIRAGSTMVRIGRALFGERPSKERL